MSVAFSPSGMIFGGGNGAGRVAGGEARSGNAGSTDVAFDAIGAVVATGATPGSSSDIPSAAENPAAWTTWAPLVSTTTGVGRPLLDAGAPPGRAAQPPAASMRTAIRRTRPTVVSLTRTAWLKIVSNGCPAPPR